jgi:hypothetical protein
MMAAVRRVGEDREAQENVLFAAHRQGIIQMRRAVLAVALFMSLASIDAAAQAPSSPRGTDIPRTREGKPDFTGIWQVMNSAAWDIQDHQARKGVPAGMGVVDGNEIPYQPSALAKKRENFENRATADPETKCYLPGLPRLMYMPFPFQIFQTPGKITMLFEYVHATRPIYTDGTPHPSGHIDWWLGDSRGRWEGDTLIVDDVDFNDETWFDRSGNFHSDQLHLVERFTPLDADHITYEVTVEDPKVFTRPWRMSMILYRHREANLQLLEYECYTFDNEFHVTPPK